MLLRRWVGESVVGRWSVGRWLVDLIKPKCRYHHAFCWLGDQSVLNNILIFPSFHHQHWNQEMSLISSLCQIFVHSHKLLGDITLQNYMNIYYWGSNEILKRSVQLPSWVLSKRYKANKVSYMRRMCWGRPNEDDFFTFKVITWFFLCLRVLPLKTNIKVIIKQSLFFYL